jgi:hypothetical protein
MPVYPSGFAPDAACLSSSLENGAWHYRPALPPLPQLRLARSSYTSDYSLCWKNRCHPMAEIAGPVERSAEVVLSPC